MLKRLILSVLILVSILFAFILLIKDDVIEKQIKSKLQEKLSQYGMQISYDRLQFNGLNELLIFGLRVDHPKYQRMISLGNLEVQLMGSPLGIIEAGLNGQKPKIEKIELKNLVFHVNGKTPKEVISYVKEMLGEFIDLHQSIKADQAKAVVDTQQAKESKNFDQKLDEFLQGLPNISIEKAELISRQEGVWIHDINATVSRGAISGKFYANRPKLFSCLFSGLPTEISLECEHPFAYPIQKNLEITGKKIKWLKYPYSAIQLSGVKINYKNLLAGDQKKQQISLSLILGLDENTEGQRRVKLRLDFLSSGGKIEADGLISKEQGILSTKLHQFPLQSLSAEAQGTLSANLNVSISMLNQKASFSGQIEGQQLLIQHEALAEQLVGPFDLKLSGEIEAKWQQKLTELGLQIKINQGNMALNQIDMHLNASFDNLGDATLIQADASMSKINAKDFAVSVPSGLLPHLEPFELEGELGFSGEFQLNTADLDSTILDVKSDLKKLKVISHNEAIDFQKLRTQFTTTFEMTDEEKTVYSREVGPLTTRWTPLAQINPLFPKAIVAQEDGGFYRHSGISMMALRDSLIDNLKQGKFVRGGSTITMQLVKNLFLHRKKTLSRKLEELCITWLLEQNLTKDEMMELYLNVVEFGTNVFGVKEASQKYFSKLPEQLSAEEVVALTRLLPGPRIFEKFFIEKKLSPNYTARVNRHLKLLEERGLLDGKDYQLITPTSLWENTVYNGEGNHENHGNIEENEPVE